MVIFFTVLHVTLAVFMILVILLQPGKDAGMGAALGGGSTQTVFGGRGAVTFLTKLTAICAAGFFMTSLGLSFVGMRASVVAESSVVTPTTTPPAPGAAAPVQKAVEQGNAADAPGKAAPPAEKPSATDAVPAEKLPQ